MRITFKVKQRFIDKENGTQHFEGEGLMLEDEDRATYIMKNKIGELISIKDNYKSTGEKVIVYCSRVFEIGGIETACWNIAKQFSDRNIVFLFGEADIKQAIRIAKYRPVIIDRGQKLDCSVLLVMGYDGIKRLKAKIEADKIYFQIHADWSVLKGKGLYKDYTLDATNIDKLLAVSETAQKGLKEAFGLDSVVVPNILTEQEYPQNRIFCVLTRFEQEKGVDILIEMIKRFESASNGLYKQRMLWVVCGTGSLTGKFRQFMLNRPYVILLNPSLDNQGWIEKADYLVQTSYCESYCYSIHQALALGTPVISTAIPEAVKVIEDGKNGYLVNFDLQGLDVEKIMEKKPSFKAQSEKVEPIWEKVLKGEL